MKAIVTGGSGFIGTNLVNYLKIKGWKVLSLDIVKPRDTSNNDVHVDCDILDIDLVKSLFINFEPNAVFHLAARTDLLGEQLEDYAANIQGVDNICSAVSELQSCTRMVAASSMLVCKPGYEAQSISDTCPTTIYGESKVETERTLLKWKSKLPFIVIVRPTSIWGPWFSEPYKNFFDTVLRGYYFHIRNRPASKTYGYVENTVAQIVSLAFSNVETRKSYYYLGDEEPMNISIWADMISLQSGMKKNRSLPLAFFYIAGKVGDFLGCFGVNFPMTSFRLKNMTTDNVCDCKPVCSIVVENNINIDQGVKETLQWIKNIKK